MKKDNWKVIKQLEMINECIIDECQGYLYYLPRNNMRIFERIKNASNSLLNNALRLFRNQKPLIQSTNAPLTITRSKELMLKIYQAMINSDFPINTEQQIIKLLKEYALEPEDLLQLYPSDAKEEFKNRKILNGDW